MDWEGTGTDKYPAQEYTLKVYSKMDLEIKDADGETNMWHMDGQYPSRFTKSHFRATTTKKTPTFKPKSLYDIYLVSNNVGDFMSMYSANSHLFYRNWW